MASPTSNPSGSRNPRPPNRPALGHANWARGVALARGEQLAGAARAFERAVAEAPHTAPYWLNLAGVRRREHRIDEALRCARRAFNLEPTSVPACHLCAELLRHQNLPAQALAALQALEAVGEPGEQHLLLEGSLRMALADWQGAAVAFLKVLTSAPGHIEAYQQLGFALANLGQHADASECFRTVALLEPQLGSAIYSAHYSAWACDWPSVAADMPLLAAAMPRLGQRGSAPGFSPFCLLSLNDDAAMHRQAAAVAARHVAAQARSGQFSAAWGAPAAGPAGHPIALAHPRCRIGFVSADFRTHATSMLLVRTLERLDRTRFEVALYSHGNDDKSALRRRLIDAVDEFVECREMSVAQQAERIRADGVTILIDLSGYTASSRLGVFALRPAPVQVLWLAYPSTTGADFIDYLIGDPVLTPLAHADDFSEQIAQLPICYEPTDELRERPSPSTRAEAGLPDGAFVYACFNQSYKITETVFSRWCRILHRVPQAVLWLLVPQPAIQARLRAAAAARGIAADRLIFAPFVAPGAHLARLPLADLFLDTFPYGAHTTCSDALWMGLPVLTQVGCSFSARVAASLLHAVGLPELAVETEADYETLAVLLANDTEALRDIRAHLADPLALPLFDSARFSRELGALFQRMAERWAAGQAPAAIVQPSSRSDHPNPGALREHC
jgi:protein O-GlcNAc transferase